MNNDHGSAQIEGGPFSVVSLFGDLPLLKVRICARLPDEAAVPRFLGSAWRGLIGWELVRLVCPFDRRPRCGQCPINDHCPYFLLLEKRSTLPGLLNAPRGYVLYCFKDGNSLNVIELEITLFGSCIRFLPVLAMALFKGQESGLAAGRYPYEIISFERISRRGESTQLNFDQEGYVFAGRPALLRECLEPSNRSKCRVRLATPLRLRRAGKYLAEFDLPFFLATIARRIEAINCLFHSGKPLGKEIWGQLQQWFNSKTECEAEVRWVDLERYSNRQRRKVPMGGIIGDVFLGEQEIFEWLAVASLIHVGKGAAMGLGKVEIIDQ